MLNKENNQRDLYSDLLDSLIKDDHPYVKLLKLIDFSSLCEELHDCYSQETGCYGYPIETAFKCIFIQQFEDISDRRMENYLRYDLGAKYFCGLGLMDKSPDHSFFGRVRKKIGTERMVKLFNSVIKQLEEKKVVSNVFHFVDSTAITTKISLWEEYDKAHAKEHPKSLCNENIAKYANDKDARIGCKGKNKYWFGYKRHQRVDMTSRIITAVKITPANETDANAGLDLLPKQGMIFADKGYDTNLFEASIKARGLHSGIIKKNNRADKNRDKDKWISSMRMPFEGLFSKADKRTPYIGIVKVEFHQTLDAFVQNFKRLIKMESEIRIT